MDEDEWPAQLLRSGAPPRHEDLAEVWPPASSEEVVRRELRDDAEALEARHDQLQADLDRVWARFAVAQLVADGYSSDE